MNANIKIRVLFYGFFIMILTVAGIYILKSEKDDPLQPVIINTPKPDNSSLTSEETISQDTSTEEFIATPKEEETLPNQVLLSVPYINEAPSNNWTGPWKNGCEEASIAMVEMYYQGKTEVSIKEAEAYMQILFDKQDQLYGSNHDADMARVFEIVNTITSYKARIIEQPSLEKIKKELFAKHPVISPHYGKDLNNPNIPFLRSGSYYHMMVIIGYDDQSQEFIVHDTGDIKKGAGHRYKYDVLLNSIHDFDFTTKKANGPSRVIFTSAN